MKITTLLENSPSENKALKAEHGLSFYVEVEDKKILFDCSSSEAMLYNAKRLNIDLEKIDYVVLSHSHYDHAAGFVPLVEAGYRAPLYTGTSFWEAKYACHGNRYTYLGNGFSKDFLVEHKIEHHYCETIKTLFEGCYLIGHFKKFHEFEVIPKRFVKQTERGFEEDGFSDEICMVIQTDKGLVVVVGCSHPGLLNMLTTIQDIFKESIYAVFGGSHLVEGDEQRTGKTKDLIMQMGIKVLGLNHCTGEKAIRYFQEHAKEIEVLHLRSGDSYYL